MRRFISSGSVYETRWGYSRAVVDGDAAWVSGTTGFDYATMKISEDPAEQARQAFRNVAAALAQAGFSLYDVVRVRYYVASAADWEAVGAVAGDVLGDVRPAATAVVCQLVDPAMKVEIEVDARRRRP
jgi:enamine deaminase RidA (YjgF/YER057c/UK114 family)